MRAFLLVLLLFGWTSLSAQLLDAIALDSVRTFRSIEQALKTPALVQRLDLSGAKLKVMPEELRQFTNLNALDLSGNKIKEFPAWFSDLQYLQELRVSRNKLETIPATLFRL